MGSVEENEKSLIERFVKSFAKLDEMRAWEDLDPVGWRLSVGGPDEHGQKCWQPLEVKPEPTLLEPLYAKLPARFPPLYERFVLSYRWAEVDLGSYRLLANAPGCDLSGLFTQVTGDQGLWEALPSAGYIQFAKGPDCDYDPVCFEIKSRKENRDCRIVKIDHEEILCWHRVKVVAELAPSFEQLMVQTIERANKI